MQRSLAFPFPFCCLLGGTIRTRPEAQHFKKVLKNHLLCKLFHHQPSPIFKVFRSHPNQMKTFPPPPASLLHVKCLLFGVCWETG